MNKFSIFLNDNSELEITDCKALKLLQFYEYVCEFYSLEFGIYKIASCQKIVQAVDKYYSDKTDSDCYFDSVDRENIRCLLENNYSII